MRRPFLSVTVKTTLTSSVRVLMTGTVWSSGLDEGVELGADTVSVDCGAAGTVAAEFDEEEFDCATHSAESGAKAMARARMCFFPKMFMVIKDIIAAPSSLIWHNASL